MVKIKLRNCVPLVLVAIFTGFMVRGSQATFNPVDNFLIACGSSRNITFQGRTFVPDSKQSLLLIKGQGNSTVVNSKSNVPSPIYKSMRVFPAPVSYEFDIRKNGRHLVRLYFYPLRHSDRDFESALITVVTEEFVLLKNFSFKNYNRSYLFKEYVINVHSSILTITFIPSINSVTFVNGIEVISVPDNVFSDQKPALTFSGPFKGFSEFSDLALETIYRLNMGGPLLTPQNDTLGRTWENDHKYIHLDLNTSIVNVSVNQTTINYRAPVTPQTAPSWVYATTVAIGYGPVDPVFFNITWIFPVDPNFSYFVRTHFCDIVSKEIQTVVFNVYINYDIAIPSLDLSTLNGALKVPYVQDFITYNSSANSGILTVGVGSDSRGNIENLTLNGLEIMKMSNDVRSLDGFTSVQDLLPKRSMKKKNVGNIIGLALGVAFFFASMLIFLCYRCLMVRRSSATRQGHPWLAAIATIWELLHHGRSPQTITSHRSGNLGCMSLASSNLGRFFNFEEIVDATNGFDQRLLLGVGGFGSVYMGTFGDGTKVAIKRANPRSRQGPTEFQTEIKILSKVRHRHLVSLLGYCAEQSEMILVYEYMENGTLRNHLYGKDFPPLTWKQRLEICIGAARGLHYLHTGAAQSIIHRDVKTTNILLDENFVAKVADFGLSKIGPGLEQTHVSTGVKGTFGYFDPEYIRRQQLTTKSDVYSFGVVLLEILCARPVLNEVLPSEEVYIVDWAMSWKKGGMLEQIMDPNLLGKVKAASMEKFSETAEKCLAQQGLDRPTMGNVLSNLEYALQLEETSSRLAEAEGNSVDPIILHH